MVWLVHDNNNINFINLTQITINMLLSKYIHHCDNLVVTTIVLLHLASFSMSRHYPHGVRLIRTSSFYIFPTNPLSDQRIAWQLEHERPLEVVRAITPLGLHITSQTLRLKLKLKKNGEALLLILTENSISSDFDWIQGCCKILFTHNRF